MALVHRMIAELPNLSDEEFFALESAVASEAHRSERRAVRATRKAQEALQAMEAKRDRGLNARRHREERGARLLSMREAGKTAKEIASEVGLSPSYVLQLAESEKYRRAREEKEAQRKLINDGLLPDPRPRCVYCSKPATRNIADQPVCYAHIGAAITQHVDAQR